MEFLIFSFKIFLRFFYFNILNISDIYNTW